MRHEAIEKAARALVEVLDNDESLGSWTYGHFRVALDDALALPATPTPEAAARDEARAEVARLRGMMREAEEVLRGHMIGINCKGPRMDDDLAKRWRTALALHIAADSPPHDAAKVGGDE